MVLKCGPDGGGHCQPDNGTFVVYAGGRNLMPDGGSYIYSGDPEGRNWFRQTKVHQTLTLDGENSEYAPKFLLWKPGENIDILVVENQSYENLKHRRSVFFVDKKYFVIVDDAIGRGTGDVDLHFQLAPGAGDAPDIPESNSDNYSVHSEFNEGWNIFIRTNPQEDLKLEEEEGQVSFEYTQKESRPAFRYRVLKSNAENQVRFVTVVVPYNDKIPDLKAEVVGDSKIGSSVLQLKLIKNGKEKTIGY